MVTELSNEKRKYSSLTEVSRKDLISKSRRGSRERYNKRLNYQVANFRGVDLSQFFNNDYLVYDTPINDYVVTLAFPGVLTELKKVCRTTNGDIKKVNYQLVLKALRRAFDATDDVKVRCTCADFCLSEGTEIKLLDGRDITVEELLEEFNSGKSDLWVYSVDEDSHDFRPGHVSDVWIKGYVNQLIEVELDNGKVVKCTPDHLFMLRDGTYCKAEDLTEGQSLMPLYFQCNKATNGYDTVKFNSKSYGYNSVYKEVAKYELQDEIEEARKRSGEDVIVDSQMEMTEENYFRLKSKNTPRPTTYWSNFHEMVKELGFGEYNHYVTKITKVSLNNAVPVYDLTVDKYNNFLVSAGVIVHNCYRFMYWANKNGYLYGPMVKGTEQFPEKTNPDDMLGATCKHLDLFLSNKRWLIKAASIVTSIIKAYPEKAEKYLYDPEDLKKNEEPAEETESEETTEEVPEEPVEDDDSTDEEVED